MASGTILFPKSQSSGRYIEAKIEWESVAYNDRNTSDVTVNLYVRKGHHSQTLTDPTGGSWKYSLDVSDSTASGSVKKSVLTWELLRTRTITDIAHNSDGTKSVTIAGSVTGPASTSLEGHKSSGSEEIILDTIPRASVINSIVGTTLGEMTNVLWTPLAESFYYKVVHKIGEWSAISNIIDAGSLNNYTYARMIPMDAATQIVDGKTGTMVVSLFTYEDSEATIQIGEEDTVECTVTIPDTVKPTAYMILTPVSNLPSRFSGLYLQGHSRVKAEITADFQYDAQPSSYGMTIAGKTYSENEKYTSDYLSTSGKVTVVGKAIDSRGFEGVVDDEISIIPYTPPKLLNVSVERCDKDGNLTGSGTYLRIVAKRDYSPVKSDGNQMNFCVIQYRYKTEAASTWPDEWLSLLSAEDLGTDEVTTEPLLGMFSAETTYEVEVQVKDYVGLSASTMITVPTDSVYMHRCGPLNSMGLGKYVERPNLLDCAWDINTDGNLSVGGDILIGKEKMSLKDYILSIVNEGG